MAKNKQDQGTQVEKTFGLTNLALNNRNTVYFLAVLIVFMGITTYRALPKDSYPEIEQPIVYVGTSYAGNSPIDMENLVTRPIEKELNTISEIDEIKSTSVQGYSTIIAEFTPETDIEDALQKAKDAVDRAMPELPTDLDADPNVFDVNFSEFPIMNINLSGDYSMDELEDYGEILQDEIEKITEISSVDIRGVEEKEVQINVNPFQMEAREVSFGDIESAVAGENRTISSGEVLTDGIRRAIRVEGEFKDPQKMLDIIVKQENNAIIYLGDIAEVDFTYKEKESYARLGKQPVVSVDVVKRSGENLLIATDKINAVLDDVKKRFPDDLEIKITNDQSAFTADMVSSLENNIISGVILVVLVLLFFLGVRNALFVGIAIPLSMFIAFNIIGALDYTVNMMILFSLIMALGMLVDNGIVVVENVYRKMEIGLPPLQATREGVGEVALPIIASTATTLAAFLPLVMWPGLMGQFMSLLPIGLIITLSSSLFVALVINPVLIAAFMRVKKGPDDYEVRPRVGVRNTSIALALGAAFLVIGFTGGASFFIPLGNLSITAGVLIFLTIYVLDPAAKKFQNGFLPRLENAYSDFLAFALSEREKPLPNWHPLALLSAGGQKLRNLVPQQTIGNGLNRLGNGFRNFFLRRYTMFFVGTFILLIVALQLLQAFPPKVLFFPENKPKYVNVFIEFPVGTDITETNAFTEKIESRVLELVEPYRFMVESVIAKVGEDTSDPNDPSAIGQSATPNKARITVNFVEFKYRVKEGRVYDTETIMTEMREGVGQYPGVTVTVDKDAAGPPVGKPIVVEITGPEFETLIDIAERMKQFINNSEIKGIEKLKTDLETGKPELLVKIDRDNARRFGLSTTMIASEIRTALFGKEISTYKLGEDDYEVQLRLNDEFRYDVDQLVNKSITFKNQNTGNTHQVPISSVADVEYSTTYGSVKRKDLQRIVTLSSNVLSGYNATEIAGQIENLLDDFNLPAGYEFEFGGEQKEQEEEMSFLGGALGLAVALIFMIIVSQFNKLTTPIIIMTSVILSTIGVFFGLVIFNMEFVVIMTMLGIISLAGIVVNNAIVLIDFIELQRERMRRKLGVEKLTIGEIKEAIREAAKTRLRPVLLTAITTILGLIPLAIGINIDFVRFYQEYNADFYLGGDNVIFWGPLSWTIIFGLTFATFLTLVVVPVMYLLFAKLNRRLGLS